MGIILLTQNGMPYLAYTDFDFASDEMLRLQKMVPWFQWNLVHMSVNTTEAKIKSSA